MADSKQPTPRLDIRTVSDLSTLERIRPEWIELLATSLRPTVLASWEWQRPCQSWATGSTEMRDAILFPPTIGGRLAAMTMKAIMGAKRLIPTSIKRGLKSTFGGSASSVDHPADDRDTE